MGKGEWEKGRRGEWGKGGRGEGEKGRMLKGQSNKKQQYINTEFLSFPFRLLASSPIPLSPILPLSHSPFPTLRLAEA